MTHSAGLANLAGRVPRRALAGALTALLIVAVLVIARQRGGLRPPPVSTPAANDAGGVFSRADDGPQSCVATMFAAGRQGDVDGYLNCFDDVMRQKIQTEVQSAGSPKRYAQELQGGFARMKGHAVHSVEFDDTDRARLIAERVYQGYTEEMRVELMRQDGDWKITDMQRSGRNKNRYGEPVFRLPAEEP